MTSHKDASVHASAVLAGPRAVLIRGASGSGKSRLAFDLILAGRAGLLPKVTLIGDDRLRLNLRDGRLMVSHVTELAGMIEIRGLGIRRCEFVQEAEVGLVVDLAAVDATRLPAPESLKVSLLGVELPRIPVGEGRDALPLVLAFLTTT